MSSEITVRLDREAAKEAMQGLDDLVALAKRDPGPRAGDLQTAADVLRQALSNPVQGEGGRWTLYVCDNCGDVKTQAHGNFTHYGPSGGATKLCGHYEAVEVVRADEGQETSGNVGTNQPASGGSGSAPSEPTPPEGELDRLNEKLKEALDVAGLDKDRRAAIFNLLDAAKARYADPTLLREKQALQAEVEQLSADEDSQGEGD